MADARTPGGRHTGQPGMLRCVHCGKRVDQLVARNMQATPCTKREDSAPCVRLYDRWIEASKGRSAETMDALPKGARSQTDQYAREIEALD